MPGSGFHLNEAQEAEFQRFAAMPSNQWPQPLLQTVDESCQRLGKCGEVVYTAIAEYVRRTVR